MGRFDFGATSLGRDPGNPIQSLGQGPRLEPAVDQSAKLLVGDKFYGAVTGVCLAREPGLWIESYGPLVALAQNLTRKNQRGDSGRRCGESPYAAIARATL